MKKLNAHADAVAASLPRFAERRAMIYHIEESAIQSADYMGQVSDVYEALKRNNIAVGLPHRAKIEMQFR